MGDVFPELQKQQETVSKIIKAEEESFIVTLDRGIEIFNEVIEHVRLSDSTTITGEDAFKLYDTYGFPLDLTQDISQMPWANAHYNKIMLDPSRAGASEILHHFKRWQPDTIVYVSCNPSTLARDAGILVNELGYTLVTAGVMDMFPHTGHVESMALFTKTQ
jgi:hypothetical protein